MDSPRPGLTVTPEVMQAAQVLEKSLTAALGTGVSFALVIGNVQDGNVCIRRVTNTEAQTAKRLYELAATAPLAPHSLVQADALS